MTESDAPRPEGSNSLLVLRGAAGGALMGLANLVPGISGGTMLLAAGVYPGFIAAIAEITTLRFKLRSLLLLGSIVSTAALGILFLAGTVKALVVEHRWIMYSLFIGLTLGGVPLVWRMARPASTSVVSAAVATFALMLCMAAAGNGVAADGGRNAFLLFLAGLAASSAMILPGVSGGYLLLLLGQYESILGTVEQFKRGLLGDGASAGADVALMLDTMHVVIPLVLGVAAGIASVSNLLKWLLRRYPKATLGALLGLLFGAVVGLWPFQQARVPQPGDVIQGQLVTAANASDFDTETWPVRFFEPTPIECATSLGLIAMGLGVTLLIGRLGGEAPS